MNTKTPTGATAAGSHRGRAHWTTLISAGVLALSVFAHPSAIFAQAPTNPPGVDPSGQPVGPDSTRPGPPSSRRPGAADPGAANPSAPGRGARPNNRGATYSGVVPGNGGVRQRRPATAPSAATGDVSGVLRRAAALRQTARSRAQSASSQARASYLAAETALLGVSGASAQSAGGFSPTVAQAAGDIRALQAAARRARQSGQTREARRLTTLATRYATGARAFFTGELRQALFGSAALPTVVIRGDSRDAASARQPRGGNNRNRTGQEAFTDENGAPIAPPQTGGASSAAPGLTPTPPPVVVPSNGPVVVTPPAPGTGAPTQPPIIVQDPFGEPDVVVQPPVVVPAPGAPRP